MAQFLTTDELKSYPLPVTAKQWQLVGEEQLSTTITAASDHLEDYMDRQILTANYTDRRGGTGTHKILLSVYPVTALSSAYSYDGLGTATEWDTSEIYINQDSGMLEFIKRDKYAFTKSYTWEFEYTAGYAAVPSPVKHAAAYQTVKMLQPLFRGGSQFTETELITDLDDQIIELLEFYKRRRIA